MRPTIKTEGEGQNHLFASQLTPLHAHSDDGSVILGTEISSEVRYGRFQLWVLNLEQ
jgi:hypothetical protein